MSRRASRLIALSVCALGLAFTGCGGNNSTTPTGHTVVGDSTLVNGYRVSSYAEVDAAGNVQKVVMTVPDGLVTNPPGAPGSGPAGAVAVLQFPGLVQTQTFFNHVELHWEAAGHSPAFYQTPQFTFEFFGTDVATVQAITTPDTQTPSSNIVPPDYTYQGNASTIAEEGTRALRTVEVGAAGPMSRTIAYLYYTGEMIGLEPMLSQTFLSAHQTISGTFSLPARVGRTTRFPTVFQATWDAPTNQWYIEFTSFANAQ